MLSDLNKHMRTVHHTYRRKAKISKEQAAELVDTATEKTSPTKEKVVVADPRRSVAAKPVIKPTTKLIPERKMPRIETLLSTAALTALPAASLTSPSVVVDDAATTESIKQELGLSSVITLEKIRKKPAAAPPHQQPLPKLTYHGPPPSLATGGGPCKSILNATQTFGSISLTPISSVRAAVKGSSKAARPTVGITSVGEKAIPPLLSLKSSQ